MADNPTATIEQVLRCAGIAFPSAPDDYRTYDTKLRHLATEVVEALGLTPEYAGSRSFVQSPDGDLFAVIDGSRKYTPGAAERHIRQLPGAFVITRHVTRWERADA